MKNKYIIRPREAHDDSEFIDLRRKVFGDDKEFIDFFDSCFQDDYLDLVIIESLDDKEVLQAALTQFNMGQLVVPAWKQSSLDGKQIEISYAICTDKIARGKGYGSHITVYARELAESSRKLSMLSPAEPSLIDFYAPLGYREFMYAEQGVVAADLAAAQCEIRDILAASSAVASCAESDTLTASCAAAGCAESDTLTVSCAEANSDDTDGNILPVSDDWIIKFENITPEKYNCYREAILAERAHIKLSEGALRFVAGSAAGAGCAGLLLVSAVRCAGSADGAQRTARAEAAHTAHVATAAEAAADGAQGAARNEVGFAVNRAARDEAATSVNRASSADVGLDTGDALPLAIAACETGEVPGSLFASELLTFSEVGGDKELGTAIAKALAARSGKHSCEYMMPGIAGSKSTAALGLLAADDDDLMEIYGGEQGEYLPYMGFTFG
ncbi:hypothetical protein [Mogibacterium timidum]|uniref:hypothetical protein n=1 Tax=Mogibacterium timidum TaxID=35519 RepID=UPI0023562816|nr:hypothetical protein [Mogibacterium timidum]